MIGVTPTRPTGGTLAWLGCCGLAAGSWIALRRDMRRGRPLSSSQRRSAVQLGLAFVARLDTVQRRIDGLAGIPNIGLLVGVATTPLALGNYRRVYDDLVGAAERRRRWHRVYPLAVATALIVGWGPGVPHDRRLLWNFRGVSLEGGDGWRDTFAFLSVAPLCEQCVEGVLDSQRIVLHLYATGQDRALCLRSLLFSVAWASSAVLTLGNSIPPIVHLISGREVEVPTAVQQGLLVVALSAQMLGTIAPRWSLGQAAGPARNEGERRIERVLRAMLVLSCYDDVRRLASALREVVPDRPMWVDEKQTSLGHVYRLSEIEVLLQMFKGTINDARVALADYVDVDAANHAAGASERATQALADALDNFRRDRRPSNADVPNNPLRDAARFNDDRFLAAVWRTYRRYHAARIPSKGESGDRS